MKTIRQAFCLLILATLGQYAQEPANPKNPAALTIPIDLAQKLLETTMRASKEATDKLRPSADKLHGEVLSQHFTESTYNEMKELLPPVTGSNLIFEHLLDAMASLLRISESELTPEKSMGYVLFYKRAQAQLEAAKSLMRQVIDDAHEAFPKLQRKVQG